jgi:hypothetical protein
MATVINSENRVVELICPAFCTSGHGESDPIGNAVHLSDGFSIAVRNQDGRIGSEIAFTLCSDIRENGRPKAPYISVDLVGTGRELIIASPARFSDIVDEIIRAAGPAQAMHEAFAAAVSDLHQVLAA